MIPSSVALRELLDQQQLAELLEKRISWLSSDITTDKTQSLFRFLTNILRVKELSAKEFLDKLNTHFLSKQSDEWLIQLYTYLLSQKNLHNYVAKIPLIRLQDNSHVAAWHNDGPNAFIATEEDSSHTDDNDSRFVKTSITEDPDAKRFLHAVGITTADAVSKVMNEIIPWYKSAPGDLITEDEHQANLRYIFKALNSDSLTARTKLISELRNLQFVRSSNGLGQVDFQKPSEVYFRDEIITTIFNDSSNIWLLQDEKADSHKEFWLELGVQFVPRFLVRDSTLSDEVKQRLRGPRSITSNVERIIDADIEGLAHVLTKIELGCDDSADISKALWNFLTRLFDENSKFKRPIMGTYSWTGACTEIRETFEPSWLTLLKNNRWLFTQSANFVTPFEVEFSDLDAGYIAQDALISLLVFKRSEISEMAKTLGINESLLQMIKEYPAEAEVFLESLRQRHAKPFSDHSNEQTTDHEPESEDTYSSDLDEDENDQEEEEEESPEMSSGQSDSSKFNEELSKRFRRKSEANGENESVGPEPTPLQDPERRADKLAEEIKENIEDEPAREARFAKLPRTVWEKRNSEVRAFLIEQYGGYCQICNFIFFQRNGKPYFKALHLVSRRFARWVERPGNVFSLCANCCAKCLHGSLEAEDILSQIKAYDPADLTRKPEIQIILCGQSSTVNMTQRHMMDLQQMVRVSEEQEKAEQEDTDNPDSLAEENQEEQYA